MNSIIRLIIIITMIANFTTVTFAQGLIYSNIWPQILCAILPNYKKTITKPELPNLKLKIPCQWTYSWQTTDYMSDGEIDYTLTIKKGSFTVHKMYFFYFAAGCAEDSCYQPLTGDYYLISPKHSRHNGTDSMIESFFSPAPYNTYYKSYVFYNSQYQSFFPFGLAVTNHVSGNVRVVYSTGNLLPAGEQYKANNVIYSSIF